MQPKILLADDHSMTRKGVKLLCELDLGFTDVAEAETCNELMRELRKEEYTHLVLDINFSDGTSLEILPNIRNLYPDLKIMIFSMQPPEIYANAIKQYGIWNYISKANPEEATIQQMNQFLRNELPARVSYETYKHNNPFSEFSGRELEILHYLRLGIGTNDIAEALNLSASTISTHKGRMIEKTNTNNLKELLDLAVLYNIN
jgi:two-component system invasion response regulator UvrY